MTHLTEVSSEQGESADVFTASFVAGNAANGGAGSAITGRMEKFPVRAKGGDIVGSAHTISYELRDSAGQSDRARPVVFIFNGGPGVSSIWLHLGGVGPFRVPVPEDPAAPFVPPYELEENPGSLLAAGDLVFIDPSRTGYGRFDHGADTSVIGGAEGDAAHVAGLIESWLVRHGRLGSEVFLVGESYGTIRASLLATRLQQADNAISVSGIALIGQAVNAQETTQRPTNIAGFVAAVPYLAITARYHGLGAYTGYTVAETADFAHEWAIGRYAQALVRGDLLPDDEKLEIADELAAFTGLSVERLLADGLRVNKEDYRRTIVPGRILGLTDTRYSLPTAPAGVPDQEWDPVGRAVDPAYTALIHDYMAEQFGVSRELVYKLADPGAHEGWDYQEHTAVGAFGGSPMPSPFAIFDYAANLRAWMRMNAHARLFVGTGHYDSLTTVGAAHHLLAQNALPRERVTFRAYEGGHMMYTVREVAAQMGSDLRAFISGSPESITHNVSNEGEHRA